MRRSSLFLFAICGILSAAAQPEVSLDAMRSKYPNERMVTLNSTETIVFKPSSKGLGVEIDKSTSLMYLSDRQAGLMSDYVPYDPHFYKVEDLEAQTWSLQPDGRYRKLPVKEFKDVQDIESESFYDSNRLIRFSYPGIESGAVMESSFKYIMENPTHLGSFAFASGDPAEKMELRVVVPQGVEIGTAPMGDLSHVEYVKEVKGKTTTHIWRAKDIKKFKGMNFTSSNDQYLPHIFVYVKSYMLKGEKVEVYGSPELLYKNSYQYIKGIEEEPNDALRAVVDSIKTISSTEDDIARNVFYWVQDHIRYIAFEDGMGGLVPRKSNLVCDRKYGDCKDMANLIKSMLDYAQVPAFLCWIGTKSINYTVEEVPLPYIHNHMIAAYKGKDGYVFLDATGKHHKFGHPTFGIQGKQAMIAIDENNFDLVDVPVVDYSENLVSDVFAGSLQGKDLVLKGHSELDGFVKGFNMYDIENAGPQNESKQLLDILERGNNKCKLTQYTISGKDDREGRLKIDYELLVQDYVRTIGDEIYFNMNLDQSFTALRPDTTERIYGADYYYAFHSVGDHTFTIPDGFKVKSMPDNLSIANEMYDVQITYEQEMNTIRMVKEVKFKTIHIPLEQIQQWSADLDAVSKAYQQVVVLEKK
ncbi:MAG: hypothetical protein RL226_728 [Bacteroidota bacterium]